MECIAIATTIHGKWTYKTVVLYESSIRLDGTDVWVKKCVLHEATTQAKIERLAKAEAEVRGIPLLPHVRQYTLITPITVAKWTSFKLPFSPSPTSSTYTINPEFEKIFELAKKSIDKPELPELRLQIEQNGMLKMANAMISTNKSKGSTVSAVQPKPNPAKGSNNSNSISNSNQEKEKEVNFMALVLIKKSSLPVSPRGKTGSISVAVRENGQIGFSTSAGKVFDNFTHCAIGWDGDGRLMTFYPVNDKKLPKGIDADNLMVVGQSKDGQRYISAAGVFKLDGISYDYKSAGTHSFTATILEGNKGVSFSLPVKMDKKPAQVRVRKAKAAVAGATNGGQTVASGEPVLQEA